MGSHPVHGGRHPQAPLIGRLFDRSGPRKVYSLGLILLGGAFLIAAYAQHLWQFQLSLGLCVGLGIAFIGNVPNSILLGRSLPCISSHFDPTLVRARPQWESRRPGPFTI